MYDKYNELIESLCCTVKEEIAKGICGPDVNGHAVGEMVDMIKDLEDAKKNRMESSYYATVTSAMMNVGNENEWENDYDEVMGYNPNRHANGRYASSGGNKTSGSRRGFHSDVMNHMPKEYIDNMYLHDPDFERDIRQMRRGYDDGRDNRGNNRGGNYPTRRGYDMSPESVEESLENVREMWDNSDSMHKKKMIEDVTQLLEEMKKSS